MWQTLKPASPCKKSVRSGKKTNIQTLILTSLDESYIRHIHPNGGVKKGEAGEGSGGSNSV